VQPLLRISRRVLRKLRSPRIEGESELGGSAIGAADIIAAIAGRLAKYKHPKRVIFVDELPRNTMGKVQKNLLREAYGDLYAPKAG